ncbi:MAG: thioredoxin family protein [Gammaproteobacteria bacterium]|nr:thioredoxin family protein [Gammaproteobacteria bacterium]
MSWLRYLMLLPVFCASLAQASSDVPAGRDFSADARQVRQQKLPLILYFHTATCPYCRRLEDLYLVPMLKKTAKAPQFILRGIEIDQGHALLDFSGRRTDMRAFARTERVSFVPTLRFVGPDGKPLVPDLVGLGSRDFFYAELEESIRQAGEKLGRRQ